MVWGTFCALALKPTGNGPKTERLACRGGRYISGANAGFFALLVRTTREMHAPSLGFRPAFASDVGSPMVMAVGTERGKRGPFPPRCKTGKSQQPRVASRQRKRRGALFMRWPGANQGTAHKWSGWLIAAVDTPSAQATAFLLLPLTWYGRTATEGGVSVPLSPQASESPWLRL